MTILYQLSQPAVPDVDKAAVDADQGVDVASDPYLEWGEDSESDLTVIRIIT